MRYLIDGHNLIAQLPDIDISAEDDEAQLVLKLRSFCTRTGKKATVVFDGGLPGGISQTLSTSQVTAKFASAENSTADRILLEMIRNVKNPKAYTLVSSDQELIDAAEAGGMPFLRTSQFIHLMRSTPRQKTQNDTASHPTISAKEVQEWLEIFSQPRPKD